MAVVDLPRGPDMTARRRSRSLLHRVAA